MKLRYRSFLVLMLLIIVLYLHGTVLCARISVPEKPAHHVVDLAGIINDEMETGLNKYLLELEQKTTAQFVVLTVTGLEGESLEDFSISIAHDTWKLGQKGKDNGVLLLVALQDRKYRFEIGYGLEGILPDSRVGSIGRQYLVPYFRAGDYSRGIFEASLAVINVIAADAGVEITGMPQLKRRYASPEAFLPFIPFIILLAIFFKIMFFNSGIRRRDWYRSGGYGGFGRGWGGGGWSSGGGFGGSGGFGGGGGGGFGGGGASGSW